VAEGNTGDEREEVEVRFFQAVHEGAIALLPTVTTISLALATGLITDEVNTSPARLKGGCREANRGLWPL
jgi:hypothetical protein